MRLEDAFAVVPATLPGSFDQFTRHLTTDWVEDALILTGTASVRRRRLPAEAVVWLLIGMALMRDESIERVAALLGVALPSTRGELVARSALTQARQRLGEAPLEYLFAGTGAEWSARSADAHRWKGLALYAMDGVALRVPDSQENWAAFGGQVGNGKRAGSAYPTVRAVALMAVRSHLISAMRFGSYKTGEVTLAREMWPDIPDDSLTIVDRNFVVAGDLTGLHGGGSNRQWLTRAKSTVQLRTVEKLGKGDALVEIKLSAATRKKNPGLPEQWMARAIRYKKKGFRTSTLLTSLMDSEKYPRDDVVALYHDRWEIELGYDEIKTHMLAREEAIRSRTPDGVRQEIWAIGLAYNLVRAEMERAADEAGVLPTRISFVNALSMICHAWIVWSTPPLAPGRIPSALLDLRQRLRLLLLPERRPDRRYPRVVKLKMSAYDKKWVNRPRRAI
jgi:Insertion element 4 transposase N-terminal/Transposase DDE domain